MLMFDFTGAAGLCKIYVHVCNCIYLLALGDHQVHDLLALKLQDTHIWDVVL
jgi:hypothetical protein